MIISIVNKYLSVKKTQVQYVPFILLLPVLITDGDANKVE